MRSDAKAIKDVLGAEGKMLILAHKGLLTAGASIECALSYYIRGENLCRAQLLAEVRLPVGYIPIKTLSDSVFRPRLLPEVAAPLGPSRSAMRKWQ